ncbi:hypothetical protein C6P41_004137 [Kluyveromyces marxianus]|nr:hypothetical protein C6P43_004701 [Kluyveromyces marxianus]KAG0681762.1 hypothetical protein C6P41_004137 [Kluyveromyces marxianus]
MDLLDNLDISMNKRTNTYQKENDKDVEAELEINKPVLNVEKLVDRVKNRLEGRNSNKFTALRTKELDNLASIDDNIYEGEQIDDEYLSMHNATKSPRASTQTQVIETESTSQTQIIQPGPAVTYNAQTNTQLLQETQIYTQVIEEEYKNGHRNSMSTKTPLDINSIDLQNLRHNQTFPAEKSAPRSSFQFKLDRDPAYSLLSNTTVITENVHTTAVIPTQLDTQNADTFSEREEQQKQEEKQEKQEEKQEENNEENNRKKYIPIETIPLMITNKKYSPQQFIDAFDESDSSSECKTSDYGNNIQDNKPISNHVEGSNDVSIATKIRNENVTIKARNQTVIELNSSSESEDDFNSISTKAALLAIKAKRSKNKKASTTSTPTPKTDSLKELFTSLKVKNRKQILEHRKELSDKKGISIEAIENEKIQVEKLLEQELERNRRIKMKEKREREKSRTANQLSNTSEINESDVPESDVMESDISLLEDDVAQSSGPEDINDMNTEDGNIIDKKKIVNPIIQDDEDEEENGKGVSDSADHMNASTNGIGINLGHYGDNLDFTSAQERETDIEDEPIPKLVIHSKRSSPGKRKLLLGELSSSSEESSDSYTSLNDEEKKELLLKAKLKRREEAKLAKKRKAELKSSGINKIFEMEAEESEDEWHGVGGADGENSDDYDSELDDMLDDISRNKFDTAAIRQKLAAENKELDEKMINKILHDIKTGGFRKRGKGALDLELSDDEDEFLREFRERRREEMRRKILANPDGLPNNEKSKAFFESMIEETDKNNVHAQPNHDQVEDNKKKLIISEEFVQSSLSFLSAKDDEINEFKLTRTTKGELEDLESLKQVSSIKVMESPDSRQKRTYSDDVDEASVDFKLPSIIKSFSSNADINDKFKTGVKTVTVSKSYKVAAGSKSAVTFLRKKRKLKAPKAHDSKKSLNRKSTSSLFDSNADSFS